MAVFNNKNEKEEALKDIQAHETALEKLGIRDKLKFADQTEFYNADH